MTRLLLVVGIVVGVVVVVVTALLMYAVGLRRSHQKGTTGFVQKSRLNCPKCGQVFDYTWVPGAALTAVRLGRSRYMACPICHKWSMFDVWDAPTPPPPSRTET